MHYLVGSNVFMACGDIVVRAAPTALLLPFLAY